MAGMAWTLHPALLYDKYGPVLIQLWDSGALSNLFRPVRRLSETIGDAITSGFTSRAPPATVAQPGEEASQLHVTDESVATDDEAWMRVNREPGDTSPEPSTSQQNELAFQGDLYTQMRRNRKQQERIAEDTREPAEVTTSLLQLIPTGAAAKKEKTKKRKHKKGSHKKRSKDKLKVTRSKEQQSAEALQSSSRKGAKQERGADNETKLWRKPETWDPSQDKAYQLASSVQLSSACKDSPAATATTSAELPEAKLTDIAANPTTLPRHDSMRPTGVIAVQAFHTDIKWLQEGPVMIRTLPTTETPMVHTKIGVRQRCVEDMEDAAAGGAETSTLPDRSSLQGADSMAAEGGEKIVDEAVAHRHIVRRSRTKKHGGKFKKTRRKARHAVDLVSAVSDGEVSETQVEDSAATGLPQGTEKPDVSATQPVPAEATAAQSLATTAASVGPTTTPFARPLSTDLTMSGISSAPSIGEQRPTNVTVVEGDEVRIHLDLTGRNRTSAFWPFGRKSHMRKK
ncbi:hypothetical protein V5799_034507 [Amblyomma americanum]|uniref:Uncharacterized protein n=1 Tax=Amblyomma americanum TaxID=6943 RepID=A0AAQ4DK94_AMBAM